MYVNVRMFSLYNTFAILYHVPNCVERQIKSNIKSNKINAFHGGNFEFFSTILILSLWLLLCMKYID